MLMLGIMVLLAIVTAGGMLLLWPDADRVADAAQSNDATAPGTVLARGEVVGLDDCDAEASGAAQEVPVSGAQGPCLLASVGVRTGEDAGRMVSVPLQGSLAASGLKVGDRVDLAKYPKTTGEGPSYVVTGIDRGTPLLVLALVCVAVIAVVGRLRGVLALIALGLSAGVLLGFVLPALVSGESAVLVGLVGSSAIMFFTLYFVHGLSMRTTAALLGTLCGIVIIAGVSLLSIHLTRLSGIADEESASLAAAVSTIDFRGLLSCSVLIAGLGVLNDVTITQASSVWELRAAGRHLTRRELYRRAMRIGRDHIASTVYTVFFAYAGAAISVLILLYLYDRPLLSVLSTEAIAIEIVRTLCGSIGLVLAVPITTWLATRFVAAETSRTDDRRGERGERGELDDLRSPGPE